MAVKIRMKMMGRRHRPFFRICVTDVRTPRDGRVLEEVGYYDPMVPETDARAVLNSERINYWIGVGAKPSDRVAVLIKKYGANGTHLVAQNAAVERLNKIRHRPATTIRPIIAEPESDQTQKSKKTPDKKLKAKSKANKEQTNNDTV